MKNGSLFNVPTIAPCQNNIRATIFAISFSSFTGAVMYGLRFGLRAFIYQFDSVNAIKDRIHPVKHFFFGRTDSYRACHEISSVRDKNGIRVVFDVGAAIGNMTRFFLYEYPNAMIYAFEPNPDQFARFLRRIHDGADRVKAFNCGLAAKPGTATLRRYSYPDASSFLPITNVTSAEGITEVDTVDVKLRTLDDIVSEIGVTHIDFLKIDVEGFEYDVLAGGYNTLAITDNAYIEVSPLRHMANTTHHIDVFSKMQKAGFTYIGCFGDYFFSKDPAVLKHYFS